MNYYQVGERVEVLLPNFPGSGTEWALATIAEVCWSSAYLAQRDGVPRRITLINVIPDRLNRGWLQKTSTAAPFLAYADRDTIRRVALARSWE